MAATEEMENAKIQNFGFNKIFSGGQPRQMVQWRVNKCFEIHLCRRRQRTGCLVNLKVEYNFRQLGVKEMIMIKLDLRSNV